jgi:hypothetical protein
MAKSPTRKKQKAKLDSKTAVQLDQAINQAVEYVNSWKRKELINIVTGPTPRDSIPVCVPVKKDTYIIGNHGLTKTAGEWRLTEANSAKTYSFVYRSSAVVYSICSQIGKPQLAQDILERNQDIIRLQNRLEEFRYLQDKAKRKKDKDYWRLDYYNIMSESAEFAIVDAKNQLEKSLNLAKYFRIWE